MKYQLALFDFDGTLADSVDWFLKRLNKAAEELKFRRIEEADFEKIRGFSSQQVIDYLGLPLWKLPLLMRRMRKAAAEEPGAIKLFPGTAEMLEEMVTRRVQVGIVSSNSEENIRRTLGRENAKRIGIFSCGASLFGKSVRLRAVLRRSRVDAKAAIYIGDEIRDAVAAREVGMSFGAVAWGNTTMEALRREKPAFEFGRMEEIMLKIQD